MAFRDQGGQRHLDNVALADDDRGNVVGDPPRHGGGVQDGRRNPGRGGNCCVLQGNVLADWDDFRASLAQAAPLLPLLCHYERSVAIPTPMLQ